MKIEVQTEVLRDALGKILSVIDKKISRPILTYCQFVAQNESITLYATDLEVSSKIIINAKVEKAGDFCINVKNIFDVLRELPGQEQLLLSISEDYNHLKITCKEIHYSLLICKSDEYPQLVFENLHNKFILRASLIQDVLRKISYAMSTDETRLFINGIFLQEINSKLRAVATDGHQLALVDIDENIIPNSVLTDGIIIPRKGVSELKKIADSYPDEEMKFSVDESFIYVNVGNKYFLSIRLIARDYVKYDRVIPKKTMFSMIAKKNVLLAAIKRIKILANEKSNGIALELKKHELKIVAHSSLMGDAEEKIPVEYEGNEITIGFNATYLVNALDVLPEGEVVLEFNNEITPVLARSRTVPDFLGLLMPMSI